jgi:hypothetical protein
VRHDPSNEYVDRYQLRQECVPLLRGHDVHGPTHDMNHMGIQWSFLFLDTADTVKKKKTLLGSNRQHHDRHTANMVEV